MFSNFLNQATTFSGIPSSATSLVSMSFPDGSIAHAGNLEIDYDGNGTTDLVLSPNEGETVTLPEPTPLELIDIIKEKVRPLNINSFTKTFILKGVSLIELKIKYNDFLDGPENIYSNRSLIQSLTDLVILLVEIEEKGKVTFEDIYKILDMLKKIERAI